METVDTYLFTHEYLTDWSFNKDQFDELLVSFAVSGIEDGCETLVFFAQSTILAKSPKI